MARHTALGANRGAMPPGHTFIRIDVEERRAMYEDDFAPCSSRPGLTVDGGRLMVDSSDIDAAVIAVLQNDATLRAAMPDGVFFGLAGPSFATGNNATKFVLVSVLENLDRAVFGGRAIESVLYLVQAVSLSGDSKGAAKRIDELLENLPVDGRRVYLDVERRANNACAKWNATTSTRRSCGRIAAGCIGSK